MPRIAKTLRAAGLFTFATTLAVSTTACKKPDEGRAAKRTVKASIADFDPNEDVVLDLDKYGTARVDDYLVEEAFNRTFDNMDKCVDKAKTKAHVGAEKALEGDADFTVKLNPSSERPFAVNAVLSSKKWDQNKDLKDCLREAVANAGYPMYDGPPQVAVFSTQLDPGSTYVEDDNDW